MDKNIGLLSLNDHINTFTSSSRAIFFSLAKFQQNVIYEKTNPGLTGIRTRGRSGGKPPGLSKEAQATAIAAETLYLEQKLSVQQIAEQLGICKATLYAYLKYRKVAIGSYATKEKATQTEPEHSDNIPQYWHPAVD